ncbi:MAG: FtsH protease activity modulator HflK [Deltaproteobacteria bacterium]|nr:FtsH protease activity modulator HflK [Deltaproteobacteria bacterium]
MNWDWDKLQDKRRRQAGQTPPGNHREEDEDDAPPGPPPGGGRGGGRGIGRMGDAFRQFRRTRLPAIRIILILVLLGWLASGIFIVDSAEIGVITRFGAYNRVVDPGPHYHLPFPIEEAVTPKVHHVQRVEIGFRTLRSSTGQNAVRGVLEEAAMLTGDENIVNVQFIVQYQIKDPVDFLFKADLQIPAQGNADIYSETVKNAAEAAMREVIGGSLIDSALTDGKNQIQIESRDLLQGILDRYSTGILIQAVQLQDVTPPLEVSAAFKDVASAREDRSRSINEAEAYRNEILPRTSGEVAEILNRAEAYKRAVVEKASGEAQHFLSVLTEYNKAQDITRKRMYIETMEEILSSPGMEKIILGSEAGRSVLPFLPLNRSGRATGGQ